MESVLEAMENKLELEQYIRKRIAEINDLDERKFAKELLVEGLLPVFELIEQRYLELEERIRKETEISDEKYAVFMTVIKQEDYDPINDTLFPVCPDLPEQPRPSAENAEIKPYVIYFSGNFQRRKEFEQTGYVCGYDAQGKKHRLAVRRAKCFLDAIEELHQVFVYNRIPWTTVNTGYLDRFYEVYSRDGEDISGWEIDFEEWKEELGAGMMLLWNIEVFTFQCRNFMMPCMDEKYYEHELDLKNYDPESGYMVGRNEDILKIRYEEKKIIMTSYKETFRNWTAYRFVRHPDRRSRGYGNELLGNARRKSFFQSYLERQEHGIGSRTELFWMIESFADNTHVELWDCRVEETAPPAYLEGDMNPFLGETIFPMDKRKLLVLYFKRKETKADFCEDMVRFFVSQMQMSFCEYKCIGVLAE